VAVLVERIGGPAGARQPLGNTMHHRRFKVSMMQDGFVDET